MKTVNFHVKQADFPYLGGQLSRSPPLRSLQLSSELLEQCAQNASHKSMASHHRNPSSIAAKEACKDAQMTNLWNSLKLCVVVNAWDWRECESQSFVLIRLNHWRSLDSTWPKWLGETTRQDSAEYHQKAFLAFTILTLTLGNLHVDDAADVRSTWLFPSIIALPLQAPVWTLKKKHVYIYICQSAEQAMSIIGFSGLPGAHAQIQEQSPGERSHGVKNSLIWTHNFYQALQWSSGVWPLSFATLAPDVNLRVCRKLEFSSLKKVMGTIYFTRCHPKDMERSNLQLQQHLV